MKSFLLLLLGLGIGTAALQARHHNIAPVFPNNSEGRLTLRPAFPEVWSGQVPFMKKAKAHQPGQQVRINKTAAATWLMTGERSDSYNTTSASWLGNDSAAYTYNLHGVDLSETYVDYAGSAWQNAYRYVYTLNSSEWVMDELGQEWNTVGNVWDNDYHVVYTRNGQGLESESLYQEWSGSAWDNAGKSTTTYDGNNWVHQITYQDWDMVATAWVNNTRYTYAYNGAGKTTSMTVEAWDDVSSAWINSSQTLITYDGSNQPVDYTFQNWDDVGSAWVNSYRYVIVYTSQGLFDLYTYQTWDQTVPAWKNTGRYDYTYDGMGNELEALYQTWDDAGMVWENNQRVTTDYNLANKPLTAILEDWDTGPSIWLFDEKIEYSYNPANLLTQLDNYNWAGLAWEPTARNTDYKYDLAENLTYMLAESYNSGTSVFDSISRYFYYYGLYNVTGLTEVRNDFGIKTYPNPIADQVTIDGSFTQDGLLQVRIMDMSGKLRLYTTQPVRAGNARWSIPVGNLAQGMYVMQIADQYGSVSQVKLVK
jgi:hypothetical protein